MAEAAEDVGAPAGLIQCLSGSSLDGTRELMSHHRTAVVMATGGSAMVRTAYSSGKPTLAVGPGNVPVYVDRSKARDLDEVADMILSSKSFDYGTACAAEQAVIADQPIAEPLRRAIREQGGHICTAREAQALGNVIFDRNLNYRVENVGQSASRLAQLAGFDVAAPHPGAARRTGCGGAQRSRCRPRSSIRYSPSTRSPMPSRASSARIEILRFGGEGHTSVVHAVGSERGGALLAAAGRPGAGQHARPARRHGLLL